MHMRAPLATGTVPAIDTVLVVLVVPVRHRVLSGHQRDNGLA
jgi:hypothetical protein